MIASDKKNQKINVLKKVFGYDSFRPGQEEIVDNILAGRDVLGIMPTGAGKSICYQLPALMLSGITIVVSPLISLMIDQVKALNEAGVHAAYINSALSENQVTKALYNAMFGRYKIVYVAPERLETNRFLEFVMNADISMITVDEAHCISQWGQDFRPSYLKIVNLIKMLPKRPVVSAFTATATAAVKDDIACVLGLEKPFVKVTGFDRENLYFEVRHPKHKDAEVLDYVLSHRGESGIIYCATRKNVDKVYLMLKKNGVAATRYHAGLDNDVRRENQSRFIYDETPVIVATNAFGMGIDKSNVRYVLHYNMPQCIENYYQEAGRAGRDGAPAECILLFSPQDVIINEFLIDSKGENSEFTEQEKAAVRENDIRRLKKMRYYCNTKDCLREYMLNYFGEYSGRHDCQNCGNCSAVFEERDVTDIAVNILKTVNECHARFGAGVIVGTLRGENKAKLKSYGVSRYSTFGIYRGVSENLIKGVIEEMLLEGILAESDDMYHLLRATDEARGLLSGELCMTIKWSERKEAVKPEKTAKSKSAAASELDADGLLLFERLRKVRLEIARRENVPPYIVFSDKTLADMCAKRPRSKEEMLEVNGVGENKYNRYGKQFLDCIVKAKSSDGR